MMLLPACMMDRIVLKLPTGEMLTLPREEARELIGRLWMIPLVPGAFLMAARLSHAASALTAAAEAVIEVTEREYGALSQVMGTPPGPSA